MPKQPQDPLQRPFFLAGFVDTIWNRISEAAFNSGWTPVTKLAEAAVVAVMHKISVGQLTVLTPSHSYLYPASSSQFRPDLGAELRVVNDSFWVRLCVMGDLGFAEAYMYGDVQCDDLVSLFHIFLENREKLANLEYKMSFLFTLPQKITPYRLLATISNSRSNISAHYDISNAMFAGRFPHSPPYIQSKPPIGFLSEDMTYSCAIYEDLDGDLKDDSLRRESYGGHDPKRPSHQGSPMQLAQVNGRNLAVSQKDQLYEAQIRKLKHIINKAKILPGHRVLEIGSGWGSMAILIAQTIPEATVDTITLSVQQQTLARERIAALGLDCRIRVHLMDYRHMPADWEDAFDRVISVEMIEAVGAEFLETYWRVFDWAMKKKGGVGVVQVISIPEARYERYIQEIDFIRKWVIFPGGFLPTLTLLLKTLQAGSSGRLIVDSVSNIGPHYARTLREWRQRFLNKFETVIVPALKEEYPDVMLGPRGEEEIEVFKRKWIYYYCYCEVGFTTRTLGDHIISMVREGYQDYGCNVYE